MACRMQVILQRDRVPIARARGEEKWMTGQGRSGIRTIFCATDFSDTSALAVRHATALARRHGADLVLAHVIEPLPVDPYPLPMALPEGEAELRERAVAKLSELAASLRDGGLAVDVEHAVGPPGPRLVELIEKTAPQLVVIGTRGQTGLQHLLLGSTAEHVVRRAPAPVLTIHPDDERMLDHARRVVVPTDLSEDAAVAIETFARLFSPEDAPKIELAFADSTPPYLDAMSHEGLAKDGLPDARRDELVKHLEPMLARLRDDGFEVVLQILDGGPVEAITRLADVAGADMIVMSTHGHSAIVNFLLGRTAQRVVQRAPCPVLTVCPKRRLAEA